MSICNNICLREKLSLIVDGQKIELPTHLRSLVVFNIDTYAGGTRPWPPLENQQLDNYKPKAVDDGVLEIFGYRSLIHMGLSQIGLPTIIPIAQGSSIQIEVKTSIPAQVDGEVS